eukprot:Tamp_11000.p1 GENE.Tamp_11000~~Tamp_11000.p1  ORF type:complete len:349 (-),score=8.19 Tamp_11000:504-1550(-)
MSKIDSFVPSSDLKSLIIPDLESPTIPLSPSLSLSTVCLCWSVVLVVHSQVPDVLLLSPLRHRFRSRRRSLRRLVVNDTFPDCVVDVGSPFVSRHVVRFEICNDNLEFTRVDCGNEPTNDQKTGPLVLSNPSLRQCLDGDGKLVVVGRVDQALSTEKTEPLVLFNASLLEGLDGGWKLLVVARVDEAVSAEKTGPLVFFNRCVLESLDGGGKLVVVARVDQAASGEKTEPPGLCDASLLECLDGGGKLLVVARVDQAVSTEKTGPLVLCNSSGLEGLDGGGKLVVFRRRRESNRQENLPVTGRIYIHVYTFMSIDTHTYTHTHRDPPSQFRSSRRNFLVHSSAVCGQS